jgi:uncharacterized protein YhaN
MISLHLVCFVVAVFPHSDALAARFFAGRLKEAEARLKQLEDAQVQALVQANGALKKQVDDLNGALNEAKKKVATLEGDVKSREGDIDKLKTEVKNKENELTKVNKEKGELKTKLDEAQAKLKQIEELNPSKTEVASLLFGNWSLEDKAAPCDAYRDLIIKTDGTCEVTRTKPALMTGTYTLTGRQLSVRAGLEPRVFRIVEVTKDSLVLKYANADGDAAKATYNRLPGIKP